MNTVPQEIRLNSSHDVLTLVYAEAEYALDAELLRVYSPSAEVRGHGRGREKLQTGKMGIKINDLQPAGNYALKIVFSDGHDSGLYDWNYLDKLCRHRDELWRHYLARIEAAGASREPSEQPQRPVKHTGCGGRH